MTDILLLILFLVLCNKIIKFFDEWFKELEEKHEMRKIRKEITMAENKHNEEKIIIANIPKSPFDDLFDYQIRERGKDYYKDGKVSFLEKDNHKYHFTVLGTNNYDVNITFNSNETEIKKMDCTCPYFTEQGQNCKHMYAALCCIKSTNNSYKESKMTKISKLLEILESMQDVIDDAELFDNGENSDLYEEIMDYEDVIHKYQNIKASDITDEIVAKAQSDLDNLEDLYSELSDYIDDLEEEKRKERTSSRGSKRRRRKSSKSS